MERTTTKPTRRAMFGGAVIALTAAASIVPASGGTDGVSPELACLIAASLAADAASEAFDAQQDAVVAQWRSKIAALPATTASYINVFGDRRTISTADVFARDTAETIINTSVGAPDTEAGQAARKILTALDDQQREKDALAKRFGLDRMNEQSDALSEATATAIDNVSAFRARNIADLEAKLSFLMERGYLDCEHARVDILADVRRLAGKEA